MPLILEANALPVDENHWMLDRLPPLMQDHREIVDMALQNLRDNLEKKLIGVNLLPERFTMKELQGVYEAILGEKLRRPPSSGRCSAWRFLKDMKKDTAGKPIRLPTCTVSGSSVNSPALPQGSKREGCRQ